MDLPKRVFRPLFIAVPRLPSDYFRLPRPSCISRSSKETGDDHVAVLVTTADTTMKPAKVEHALHMMRAYLEDCAKKREEASNRCMEELNGVIRACAERLAVDRRDDDRIRDRRLPLDALGHAIRYVDDHLDAKLKWDDMRSQLGMDALAFGRRFKASIGMTRYIIHSRLRGAVKLLRDDTMSLAEIALQVGCSSQRRLTCFFRAHASSFATLVRAGRIAVGVVTCLLVCNGSRLGTTLPGRNSRHTSRAPRPACYSPRRAARVSRSI